MHFAATPSLHGAYRSGASKRYLLELCVPLTVAVYITFCISQDLQLFFGGFVFCFFETSFEQPNFPVKSSPLLPLRLYTHLYLNNNFAPGGSGLLTCVVPVRAVPHFWVNEMNVVCRSGCLRQALRMKPAHSLEIRNHQDPIFLYICCVGIWTWTLSTGEADWPVSPRNPPVSTCSHYTHLWGYPACC